MHTAGDLHSYAPPMDTARRQLLLDIAAEFGTPAYVYDAAVVRRQLATLRAFDRVRFAQKACANTHILRLLRADGASVAVACGGAASAAEVEISAVMPSSRKAFILR